MDYPMKSEADVLKYLGVKDFRNVGKRQVMKLVSNLDKMDPAVAIECIKQFPEFTNAASAMVNRIASTCDKVIDKGHEETTDILEMYKSILESLNEQLIKDDLSLEEKNLVADTIVKVGSLVNQVRQESAEERLHIVNVIGKFAVAGLSIAGTLIGTGIAIKNGNIPKIEDIAKSIKDRTIDM